MPDIIGFNAPSLAGKELAYIQEVLDRMHLSGNGVFTKQSQALIERSLGMGHALLTHSCTGALEMAAILLDLQPGDEVIMPSFTFTSTANAVALRGAVPVFIDIRGDTLNIDETLIESAITDRTRAICVVHYAGVGAQMDAVLSVAKKYGIAVVEDAAQGMHASWNGKPLGSFGDFSAFSFHETKNLIAGEAGALVVKSETAAHRAEIIWEKGTNRAQFQRGEVAKYSWVDIGSSYLPSEITAAFLYAQLEEGTALTSARLATWNRYHEAFEDLEGAGHLRRPVVPPECGHNGHIYYLLFPTPALRESVIDRSRIRKVQTVTHYVPLHSAPAGRRFGRVGSSMNRTDDLSSRLLRLPMHARFDTDLQDQVIDAIRTAVSI